MSKNADISSKILIGFAPESWVKFATKIESVGQCEMLTNELQFISRETDSLILVKESSIGKFLALFEFQTHYTPEMPQRILAYSALVRTKFDLPVAPVLVNIMPYGKPIPNRYETSFLGLQTRQDYFVINLWEIRAEQILDQNITALIPFLPIMQGATENLVGKANVQLLLDEELREHGKVEDLRAILSLFTEAIFGNETARKIFGGKMLDIIAETSTYKEIISRGMQQGLQQGLQQGREEELREVLSKQLTRRFGRLDQQIRENLENLSFEKAENLAEAIFDFETINDLQKWLAEI